MFFTSNSTSVNSLTVDTLTTVKALTVFTLSLAETLARDIAYEGADTIAGVTFRAEIATAQWQRWSDATFGDFTEPLGKFADASLHALAVVAGVAYGWYRVQLMRAYADYVTTTVELSNFADVEITYVDLQLTAAHAPVALLAPATSPARVIVTPAPAQTSERVIITPVSVDTESVDTESVETLTVDTESLIPLTVKALKALAKDAGLHGYSRLRKADLIALVAEAQAGM